MLFRIFFFLIIFALSSNSYSQWWVDGGNLIWPHGNVTIEKDLNINGKIYMDRPVVDRNTNLFKSTVSDSLGVSLQYATSATGTAVVVDSFTAKNYWWNGLMGSENFVEINQTAGGHFDDNFVAGGVTNTVNILKTEGDTVSECYGSRSRIFTGSSNNYVKNYYGYLASIGWWVNLNMANAYSFYSDGVFFNAHSNTTNFYHFYGTGNYPSYFGGSVNSSAGYNYSADTSSTDAYKIVLKGAHSLIAGLEVTFKALTPNTSGSTLTINSLTAKALTKASGGAVNTALSTGDILAGQIVKAVYDGTQFQVISRLAQ